MLMKMFYRNTNTLDIDEVVTLVQRAYEQAWWDSAHKTDPRTTITNKAQGLARFMEREGELLGRRSNG